MFIFFVLIFVMGGDLLVFGDLMVELRLVLLIGFLQLVEIENELSLDIFYFGFECLDIILIKGIYFKRVLRTVSGLMGLLGLGVDVGVFKVL